MLSIYTPVELDRFGQPIRIGNIYEITSDLRISIYGCDKVSDNKVKIIFTAIEP